MFECRTHIGSWPIEDRRMFVALSSPNLDRVRGLRKTSDQLELRYIGRLRVIARQNGGNSACDVRHEITVVIVLRRSVLRRFSSLFPPSQGRHQLLRRPYETSLALPVSVQVIHKC